MLFADRCRQSLQIIATMTQALENLLSVNDKPNEDEAALGGPDNIGEDLYPSVLVSNAFW